jgi:hypothetical protein
MSILATLGINKQLTTQNGVNKQLTTQKESTKPSHVSRTMQSMSKWLFKRQKEQNSRHQNAETMLTT